MNENDPSKLMTATIGERLKATNAPRPVSRPGRIDARAGHVAAMALRPIALLLHRRPGTKRAGDVLVAAADEIERRGLVAATREALRDHGVGVRRAVGLV